MQNQLLERIDMIQEASIDAELDVCMSMVDIYTKTAMILENYSDEDCSDLFIFQEGEILDQAKGDKNESMIKRILLFIPRLIKAIIQKVFGSKKKQVDQMADKIIQTPIDPSIQTIEVELTFDLDVKMYEVLGINDEWKNDIINICDMLEDKQQFDQGNVAAVDKLLTHFNGTVEAIKKAQKVTRKFNVSDQNAFKEHIKNIKNRWDMTLGFLHQYIKYFDKDDIAKKSQMSTDETTLSFLSKVQQLISVMGNIAASVENIYANEMKQLYEKLGIQDGGSATAQTNGQPVQKAEDANNPSNTGNQQNGQPQQKQFASSTIEQWIRQKKAPELRRLFRMQMYGDPLLSKFQNDLKACDDWLYEPNVDEGVQLNLPESRWNKDYWNSLMLDLNSNFSRERFELAMRVAKYLMDNNKFKDSDPMSLFNRKK